MPQSPKPRKTTTPPVPPTPSATPLADQLRATFDPGGNLPDDCVEWGSDHEALFHQVAALERAHADLSRVSVQHGLFIQDATQLFLDFAQRMEDMVDRAVTTAVKG